MESKIKSEIKSEKDLLDAAHASSVEHLEKMRKLGKEENDIILRDQFAMAALTGLLMQTEKAHPSSVFAREAYICADAMMKAREQADVSIKHKP